LAGDQAQPRHDRARIALDIWRAGKAALAGDPGLLAKQQQLNAPKGRASCSSIVALESAAWPEAAVAAPGISGQGKA